MSKLGLEKENEMMYNARLVIDKANKRGFVALTVAYPQATIFVNINSIATIREIKTAGSDNRSGSQSEIVLVGVPGTKQNGANANVLHVVESPEEIFDQLEDDTHEGDTIQ